MTARGGAVLVAWLVSVAVLAAAAAGDIRVTPIITEGKVSASFTADAVFTGDVRAVVQSGLLLTFTYTIELKRPSSFWWDRTVTTTSVGSSVKFDNLTGVYQVSKMQEGQVTWSERTEDANEARTWMTTFERVLVASGDELEPNADYYLRVRLRTSPRRTFSLWPWGADDAVGRADFTFIR